MGCVCVKESAKEDCGEIPKGRRVNNGASVVPRENSRKREESVRVKVRKENGDARVGYVDEKTNSSRRVRDEQLEKKNLKYEVVDNFPKIERVPSTTELELVAAGWPDWLAEAAGESIKGWIPRHAESFEKLNMIGQGTYSTVYKARDLIHKKFVALKKVRFDIKDCDSIKFMAREFLILRRLDHPNIIKLEGLIASPTSSALYLVFEYMEHDLTGLASLPCVNFTEPQVKCYMKQLLSGLEHCHSHGVLHRDIKGSNLLIDNNGILKIADFGLASLFDHRVPLTTRVVTLWYRPPELLLGATYYGVEVDLWSSGCILGELYAGKPIMPGRTEVEQLHKIFKLCGSPAEDYWRKTKLHKSTMFKPTQPYRRRLAETFKEFPDAALELMETLLAIDPACRGTASSALNSEFFMLEPRACDPSSLPKYPPSKEIDAKLRNEEARRRAIVGVNSQRVDWEMRGSKEPQHVPAPNANAKLVTSMQRRGSSNPRTRTELYNHPHKDEASGFCVDSPGDTQALKEELRKDQMQYPSDRASYSGPLGPGVGWTKAGKKFDDFPMVSSRSNMSLLSGLVASRSMSTGESRDKCAPSYSEATNQAGRVLGQFDESGNLRKQDRKLQTQGSGQEENLRASSKEAVLDGGGFKGNKIHFSGPLLAPSRNVDQMLKDHDRQIQEATRRSRIEKTSVGNVWPRGVQRSDNAMYVSNRRAAR